MKKIALAIVVLLFFYQESVAQNSRNRGSRAKNHAKQCTVLGLGGNYALPALTGFDAMLEEFNEKYTTQDNPFLTATPFMGGSLVLTSYGNHGESRARLWYELGLHGASRDLFATEKTSKETNGISQQIYDVHVGFGAVPIQRPRFDVALAVTGDFGALRTNAKGTNFTKKYTYSQDDFFYGVTACMPIYLYFNEHISLGIRPYYQYQLNTLSFQNMHKTMNFDANAIFQPAKDITLSAFHNYGVYVHIGIAFQKEKDIRR
jgi:hypothetical protein